MPFFSLALVTSTYYTAHQQQHSFVAVQKFVKLQFGGFNALRRMVQSLTVLVQAIDQLLQAGALPAQVIVQFQ